MPYLMTNGGDRVQYGPNAEVGGLFDRIREKISEYFGAAQPEPMPVEAATAPTPTGEMMTTPAPAPAPAAEAGISLTTVALVVVGGLLAVKLLKR